MMQAYKALLRLEPLSILPRDITSQAYGYLALMNYLLAGFLQALCIRAAKRITG